MFCDILAVKAWGTHRNTNPRS